LLFTTQIIQWRGDAKQMDGALSWKNWIFCFLVSMFSDVNTALPIDSLSDWFNARLCLAEHEKSNCHVGLQASVQLLKAEQTLTKCCWFDLVNQQRISDEKLRWQNYFSTSLLSM